MQNKTYVITGSASGIGYALLERVAHENIVFAGYRNPEHREMLKAISDNVYPFFVDYTNPETIADCAEYIKNNAESVDTLINIAGCVVAGPIEKIEMSELRRQFDVNVFGHLDLSQRLAEKLRGGKIINVSSMASYGIFPFIAPYCASKRCLDILFNSFLIENKKNIKIVSIKPGVVSTPLWSKSIEENSTYFNKYEEYAAEMKYIVRNAQSNEMNGLSAEKVADTILKADGSRNPKLSYTVGNDAMIARILSKLPQGFINSIIKLGILIKRGRN